MNCLHCGKALTDGEKVYGWHRRCVKNFFGTSSFPEIKIDKRTFELLALESTNKGYTIPGVQKKISLHLESDGKKSRLTLVNYPTGYILKPQVSEYMALPEAEHLVMSMASEAGIFTVPHGLIFDDGNYAYITKRIDRVIKEEAVRKLAMEDFCQLDLRLTQDKYKGSYERSTKIIQKFSSRPGLDLTELFMRIVFSYIIGNSDMHLKNLSLIETEEGSGKYILSPAYDLLPVNIILPEDKDEFALTINGKKRNIRLKDFFVFAKSSGIPDNSADKMVGKLISMKARFIEMCQESLLPEELKENLVMLIEERISLLEGD